MKFLKAIVIANLVVGVIALVGAVGLYQTCGKK